jgi:hypothetical protein
MLDGSRPGTSADWPRYCPRCGEGDADVLAGSSLCVACGETLRDRGYCPICEDSWKLEAGALCPKHEVELLESRPGDEALAKPGAAGPLVTVATYTHPNQANAPRIRLEAEGIPTFLDGERIAGNTLYQVATGGVRLQVPASLASAARILISQTWAAPKSDPGDDLDDAWEDLAPEPGVRRRAVMKLAILVFLFGPIIVSLIVTALRVLADE